MPGEPRSFAPSTTSPARRKTIGMGHATSSTRAERETAFAAEVEGNLRRNTIANFVHGMLGLTGFRLIYAPTLIPAYIQMMTGSALMVGLGQSLLQVGAVVSPVMSASRLEHRARILPVAVTIGTLVRIQVLGLALAGYFLGGWPLLVATMTFLFIMGIFQGMQRVAFQMMISKLIPIDRRGRLQAWRNVIGGVIAAALSYAAGKWLIGGNVLGNGYATTFLLAFVLTSMGLFALKYGVVEPDTPFVRPQVTTRERLRDVPALLADRDYRWFIIAQALAMAGRIAAPFYILIATETLPLTGATIGLLSFAFLGSDTLSNLAWGYSGDRLGYKATFAASLGCTLAGIALLAFAAGPAMVVAAFCAIGAGASGYMMSAQTMVLEFGLSEDLPMRLALSTMVEGGISTLAPLVGGAIVHWLGFSVLMACAAALTVAALAILLLRVADPRRRAAPVWVE